MNDKQGRIGRQEALCIVAIAACCSGIFTVDSRQMYERGNSAYVSVLISTLLVLVVFLFTARAMRQTKAGNLWELLRIGLGPVLGRVAALLYVALLGIAAAILLGRFSLMVQRFIFPEAQEWRIAIYLLVAACVPAWLGLEGISRTSRLLVWLLAASLLGTLLLASNHYELYRLAPYLGDGTLHLLDQSLNGTMLFFPALIGLLVVARGVHGAQHASKAGYGAGIIGGVLTAVSQLCLGMTYAYRDLAQMHSPMYRLTMGFKTGGYFSKLDTLLVFGWLIGAMLAASYYIYSASLLFMGAFDMEDIRPSVAAFGACTGAGILLLHAQNVNFVEQFMHFYSNYGYIVAAAPLLLAALCALMQVRRHSARGEEAA